MDYYSISYCYYVNKKYKEALDYINKAIAIDETDYRLYYRKGWCLNKMHKKEETLEAFIIAEKLGCKWIDMYNKTADLHYMLKNNKKALEYANKSLMLDCNDSYSNYAKGFLLYIENEYDKALKYLLRAEELGYITERLYEIIAYIFASQENYNKQIQYLNKLIMYNSADYKSHYHKGKALFYSNFDNDIKAKSEFLKAEELGCEYSLMFYYLSNIYESENDFNNALKYINKAILRYSEDYDYFYSKADILFNLGKEKEANKFFQKALLMEKTTN